MFRSSLIKLIESIVLPNNKGVINVANFAKVNKVIHINNLILNFFVKFVQRNGFKKLKTSGYLELYFKILIYVSIFQMILIE